MSHVDNEDFLMNNGQSEEWEYRGKGEKILSPEFIVEICP